MTKMRVAVIGAGTAGLSAAKNAIAYGMDVVVFEQAATLGGTWVYTDSIGKDQFGLDVHSSMYKGLRTNLPKEIMGYPDFPIPDQEQSYIPAEDMLTFLTSYAKKFGVTKAIKFNHYVVRVRPFGETQWEVKVQNLLEKELCTYTFDAIMICNGHYHTPFQPKYKGIDLFKGRQMHSHDYRCPETFKGESVLVVGAGPSGMDLANEISKVAERVTLSHHLKEKPKTQFSDNVTQKPDPVELFENSVRFSDDTIETYTTVLYCTGYRYTFPFLCVDCGIFVEDNYVQPLYKHCININRRTMAFIGLPFYVCASSCIDLQARFFLKYLSGAKEFPSKAAMIDETNCEMEERWSRGYKKRQAHMMGPDQGKYYADLAETADIQPLRPVITKLHNESSQRFLDDLLNFRQEVFKIVDDETFIKIA